MFDPEAWGYEIVPKYPIGTWIITRDAVGIPGSGRITGHWISTEHHLWYKVSAEDGLSFELTPDDIEIDPIKNGSVWQALTNPKCPNCGK